MQSTLLRLALASLLALAAGAAAAQTYPARPVTLIVPYPAGGSADILARLVGQKLSLRIGPDRWWWTTRAACGT